MFCIKSKSPILPADKNKTTRTLYSSHMSQAFSLIIKNASLLYEVNSTLGRHIVLLVNKILFNQYTLTSRMIMHVLLQYLSLNV